MIKAILIRDLHLNMRSGSGVLNGLFFFFALVVIFPFAIGPDMKLLSKIAPALLWIGVVLSSLLSLDRLFQMDHEDGSLNGMSAGRDMTEIVIIIVAKLLSQCLFSCVPLVLIAPLFGLMFNIEGSLLLSVMLSLMVGIPALVAIGSLGAAITLSIPRGSLLLSIIIFPLIVPILIFGVLASSNFLGKEWLILSGLSLFFTIIGIFGAALALKLKHE
jgi:heme exporter protein B